jgi:hypothetical protein
MRKYIKRGGKPMDVCHYSALRSHLNKLRFRTAIKRRTWTVFPSYGRVGPTQLRKYLGCGDKAWKEVIAASGVQLQRMPPQPGMTPHYVGLNKAEALLVMRTYYDRYGAYWRKRLKI